MQYILTVSYQNESTRTTTIASSQAIKKNERQE